MESEISRLEREIETLKASMRTTELEVLTIYKLGPDGELHIDEVRTRKLKKRA